MGLGEGVGLGVALGRACSRVRAASCCSWGLGRAVKAARLLSPAATPAAALADTLLAALAASWLVRLGLAST